MGTGALSWIIPAIKMYRENNLLAVKNQISFNEKLIDDMEQKIRKLSGDELFEFILQDTKELKPVLLGPENMKFMVVGGYAYNWLDKNMEKWLGEKGSADILCKSVPNNITSEMGLALMHVADVLRQYPEVIEYFNRADDETFFAEIDKLEGGPIANKLIRTFLEKYGMRCPGEIDITKPRWSENPTALIPIILSNIKSFASNASSAIFKNWFRLSATIFWVKC